MHLLGGDDWVKSLKSLIFHQKPPCPSLTLSLKRKVSWTPNPFFPLSFILVSFKRRAREKLERREEENSRKRGNGEGKGTQLKPYSNFWTKIKRKPIFTSSPFVQELESDCLQNPKNLKFHKSNSFTSFLYFMFIFLQIENIENHIRAGTSLHKVLRPHIGKKMGFE